MHRSLKDLVSLRPGKRMARASMPGSPFSSWAVHRLSDSTVRECIIRSLCKFSRSSSIAIQLAKLSGFSPIITTASLRNTELLSSLGATHVLDRGLSATALKDAIAKITSNPITLAFDAISHPDTQQASYDILSVGGTLIVTEPVAENKSDDKVVRGVFGSFHPPPNREMGRRFIPVLTRWLADGTIKVCDICSWSVEYSLVFPCQPNAVEVVPGGLNGIPTGLQKLKNGLVSGRKLVVHPWETA